jgi:Fuc2NAc and GlcNAc transferase
MSTLLLCLIVFIASVMLTGAVRKYAVQLNLLDTPVERSAHSKPIPRGGGLSISLLFTLTTTYCYLVGLIPLNEYMALSGAFLIALLGLADDVVSLRMRWRLPVQFLAAVWTVYWLEGVAPINFGFFTLSTPMILSILGVLALVWLLNLYNFMDGVDGIAGTELLFVNGMALLLVIGSDDQLIGLLSAILLAAGAGFLVWNWPPAKIFMGDVGSSFIGYSLGVMALLSMHHESLTVWTWFILLGVFVVDSMITLGMRFMQGDSWYEGHACHAYQNAAKNYKSHGKVTITVLAINIVWLAPLAWLSVRFTEYGALLTIIALSPLIALASKYKAGKLIEVAK